MGYFYITKEEKELHRKVTVLNRKILQQENRFEKNRIKYYRDLEYYKNRLNQVIQLRKKHERSKLDLE